MNNANDVSGWKNEFIKPVEKNFESSILKMLDEVVRHVTMPKEREYMKIK